MKTIDDIISFATVGSLTRHCALSVYPLSSAQAGTASDYLVLDEALATGQFRITEISEAGSVPQLLAINETSSPVFLLDGEELVGAKQNRVLNLSIMLAPNSKTEVPVSCVEAGRWRAESAGFQSANRVQFAQGRAQKMAQVSRSLWAGGDARSDQGAVWHAISAKSARMLVDSPTEAMAALYESCSDDLHAYLEASPTSDGQIGAAYAIGDRLAGIEFFDSAATFRKLADKVLASYALDAMELRSDCEPPDAATVRAFIQSVNTATRQPQATVGMGETVRLSADDLVGAALEVSGGCVHLAAFRRQAFEDRSDRHRPQGARMSRSSLRAGRL